LSYLKFIDGKACFAQVRLRLSKMSQLLEDDVLACSLMSLAKAMGPEMGSLWREPPQCEQRSVLQWRAAAANNVMERATVAGYSVGCLVNQMKADFDCGVLLQTTLTCLMSSVAGRGCLL
jgi:hypothetical protein